MAESRNCLDIIAPFVTELHTRVGQAPDVQVVGGIGAYALGIPGIEIAPSDRTIAVPRTADFSGLSARRPDGNLRDLDVLVTSTAPDHIAQVEALAANTVGTQLELSVFGFHDALLLDRQRSNPTKSLAKVWVADRYVRKQAGVVVEAHKAIFPFCVPMDLATLDTWSLQVGSNVAPIPVPHPGTVLLNYLTRSVSGLRPKDQQKVDGWARNVQQAWPDLTDWAMDGPGRSQMELARILYSLRGRGADAMALGGALVVGRYSPSTLAKYAQPMASPHFSAKALVRLTRQKANILRTAERQGWVVTLYQRYAEPLLAPIVKNR